MKSWGKEKMNWCRDDYLCPHPGGRKGRRGEGKRSVQSGEFKSDWTSEQAQECRGEAWN